MISFRFLKIASIGLALMSLSVGCSNDETDFPVNPNEDPEGQEQTKGEGAEDPTPAKLPEFSGSINQNFINSISTGASVTYKLSDWQWFDLPTGFDSWIERDPADYVGLSCPGPGLFIFHNGKVWTKLSLFSMNFGPSPFADPWYAYLKVTGKNENLYVAVDFNYDVKNNNLSINNRHFDVLKFEPEEIVIAISSTYYGGEYGNGGKWKDWLYYQPTESIKIDPIRDRGFESELDAFQYILDCAHEQFGDVINLNDYYKPDIEFDYPIIDLKKLDQYLEELRAKEATK